MLMLHAAFGIRARQGQGRIPRTLPSPKALFPLSSPAAAGTGQGARARLPPAPSHEYVLSPAVGGDAQGASGFISHVGPKIETLLGAHQEGSCTSGTLSLMDAPSLAPAGHQQPQNSPTSTLRSGLAKG